MSLLTPESFARKADLDITASYSFAGKRDLDVTGSCSFAGKADLDIAASKSFVGKADLDIAASYSFAGKADLDIAASYSFAGKADLDINDDFPIAPKEELALDGAYFLAEESGGDAMATKTYTLKELHGITGVLPRTLRGWIQRKLLPRATGRGRAARYNDSHLLRAQAIAAMSRQELGLKEIRVRLGQMTVEQMTLLVVAAQRQPSPTAMPTPLPEPTYPFVQWEAITLLSGMVLMVDPTKGPVLRRIADEIYRHFGASASLAR